jgi:hypothetical protein
MRCDLQKTYDSFFIPQLLMSPGKSIWKSKLIQRATQAISWIFRLTYFYLFLDQSPNKGAHPVPVNGYSNGYKNGMSTPASNDESESGPVKLGKYSGKVPLPQHIERIKCAVRFRT